MNTDPKLVETVLEIKAVGSIKDISADLQLPDGKTIEELLDDQEKEKDQE